MNSERRASTAQLGWGNTVGHFNAQFQKIHGHFILAWYLDLLLPLVKLPEDLFRKTNWAIQGKRRVSRQNLNISCRVSCCLVTNLQAKCIKVQHCAHSAIAKITVQLFYAFFRAMMTFIMASRKLWQTRLSFSRYSNSETRQICASRSTQKNRRGCCCGGAISLEILDLPGPGK